MVDHPVGQGGPARPVHELAGSIRAAALSVPGVHAVASTGPIETATLYAGGKVAGVRVTGSRVRVHVVVGRLPVVAVADQVRSVARTVLLANGDHRAVDVVVDDVAETVLADGRAATGRGN